MMTITTTLNRLRPHSPCHVGWKKLLKGLGKTTADDEVLPYARIIEILGVEDTMWSCLAEPQHTKQWQLFAVWCTREVPHMLAAIQSVAAIDEGLFVAKAANGAAWAAAEKAGVAAWHAAMAAAGVATDSAKDAAGLARVEGEDVAWAAAKAAQTEEFLRIVGGGAD